MKRVRRIEPKKRGSIIDILFISVFMFSLVVIVIMTYAIFNRVNDQLIDEGALSSEAQTQLTQNVTRYSAIFDGIMMFVIVGLSLASIVGAFVIRSNPIFFFVGITLLLTIGIVNVVLKDTFFAFAQDNEMSDYANDFPKSTFIMTRFPFLMFAIGILIAVLTYSRGSQSL